MRSEPDPAWRVSEAVTGRGYRTRSTKTSA